MYKKENSLGDNFITSFMIMVPLSGIIFSLIFYFFYQAVYLPFWLSLASVVAWVSFIFKDKFKSNSIFSHWIMFLFCFTNSLVMYYSGGIESPAAWWFIVPPILAAFIFEKKYIISWSVYSIVAVILSSLGNFGVVAYVNELGLTGKNLYMINLVSLILFITSSMFIVLSVKAAFKKTQKENEELRDKELVSSNFKSLGSMASSIAHEINNPLYIISGSIYLIEQSLRDLTLDDEARIAIDENIQRINNSIQRATDTVKSLGVLTSSFGNEGKSYFKIADIIKTIYELKKKKFLIGNVEFSIPDDSIFSEIEVFAMRPQIVQILLNLVSNGYEAVQRRLNSWVKVEYRLDGQFLYIDIKDSGIGPDENIRNDIYQPLYTTKAGSLNKGLGLTVAKSFIEKNSGELSYDSSAKVTTFSISIPRKGPC